RQHEAIERLRADLLAEIHDGAAAAMARAVLLLDGVEAQGASSPKIAEACAAVREALAEVRDLLPLVEGGCCSFEDAAGELEGEMRSMLRPFAIELCFMLQDDGSVPTLSLAEHYTLSRLMREAANNAIRHARASKL